MNATLVRRIDIAMAQASNAREVLRREWLLTNGLGGYASGTISGCVTRRYHGLLIAALPAPFGRVVMLNHLSEYLRLPDGRRILIGGDEPAEPDNDQSEPHYVESFRIEDGLPVWTFKAYGYLIEKRLVLIHGQNTLHATYRLLSDHEAATLEIEPSVHFRKHESNVSEPLSPDYGLRIHASRYEILAPEFPHPLRMAMHSRNAIFIHRGGHLREIAYQVEADRGYPSRGQLWMPGHFQIELHPHHGETLIASTEEWAEIEAISPESALSSDRERRHRLLEIAGAKCGDGPVAELVLAADQFIINPAGRIEDAARARAAGDEIRTIIAGYHWFTDWGRDTMISLEGLTLCTGRHHEAGWILRTFSHYIRDGLLPNMFPEGEREGLYHTADATLWFFHAIDRYVQATGDIATLEAILPKLIDVVGHHLRGTRFGIAVDSRDGLLRQGADGYQLTWMDAKVDGWVVTPRRGKAVEINALWYNALRLLEDWVRSAHGVDAANVYAAHAARCRSAFNQRFWSDSLGYLFDVVDGEQGDDPACRPNQILAISLRFPVLDEEHWSAVVDVVRKRLLTPVGLRSLSQDHPDYKSRYNGDLRARDAAYHQGTVWAWLIGPFIDAWLKVHPGEHAKAHRFLDGLSAHLNHACVGSISEIFDAEEPFIPRGCIAQAWSVAEALRCWKKTSESEK